MSPASREAAEKLGYKNAKVYHEGLPEWTKRNPMALSAKLLKEEWFDKQNPIVLLDARDPVEAAKGFLKGVYAAYPFPVADNAAMEQLPNPKKKPAILVYDADGKGKAAEVAKALVKAGYPSTRVLTGGIAAWTGAKYDLAMGGMADKVVFVPKPKPGACSTDELKEFQRLAKMPIPENMVILDVRNPEECGAGMVKGAINIPVDQLASRVGELPKDKRILLHCSTGTRAEMGFALLKTKGFTNVGFVDAGVYFEDGEIEVK